MYWLLSILALIFLYYFIMKKISYSYERNEIVKMIMMGLSHEVRKAKKYSDLMPFLMYVTALSVKHFPEVPKKTVLYTIVNTIKHYESIRLTRFSDSLIAKLDQSVLNKIAKIYLDELAGLTTEEIERLVVKYLEDNAPMYQTIRRMGLVD